MPSRYLFASGLTWRKFGDERPEGASGRNGEENFAQGRADDEPSARFCGRLCCRSGQESIGVVLAERGPVTARRGLAVDRTIEEAIGAHG